MPTTPNAEEQLTLELINQFRMDPLGEYARLTDASVYSQISGAINFFGTSLSALQSQLSALSPVAPLAWNSALADAAEGHNQAMIDADDQEHQLPGELPLDERVEAAGYVNWNALGENIFAYADSPFYGHAGFVVDWGYDDEDFDGNGQLYSDWQTRGDGIQDPAGHRDNLMSTSFVEIGIAVTRETDPNTDVGEYVITHDLGSRFNYEAQFLGVIIDDQDNDDFYDIGEGMGGVTVTLTSASGTYQTTSWSSGGWQITVPADNYTITFSGGGLSGTIERSATIGTQNVKIDVEADDAVSGPTAGPDTLYGTANADTIHGLGGGDTIYGLGGEDSLFGDSGNDWIDGGSRADEIFGGSGNDQLLGSGGNDRVNGGSGADLVNGGGNDDLLVGGPGNDILIGSAGNDSLTGGSGIDTADYTNAAGPVTVDLMAGTASGEGNDTLQGIENVTGSAFDDFLYGDTDANRLDGLGGEDFFDGRAGNDTLLGGSRADEMFGGSGNDDIQGQGGNDRANGGSGADTIDGGGGNDLLVGGPGNDIVIGGADNDIMAGGSGNDRFVFGNNSGNDTITGFQAGAGSDDVLDFSALGIGIGGLTIAQQGADTLITTPGGDTVLLVGVLPAQLDMTDDLIV